MNTNNQQTPRARHNSYPNRLPNGARIPNFARNSLQDRISHGNNNNNNNNHANNNHNNHHNPNNSVQQLIDNVTNHQNHEPGSPPADNNEPVTAPTPPDHVIYIPDYSEPPTGNDNSVNNHNNNNHNSNTHNNNNTNNNNNTVTREPENKKRELDITERFFTQAEAIPISPAVLPVGPKKKQKKKAIQQAHSYNSNQVNRPSPAPSNTSFSNHHITNNKAKQVLNNMFPPAAPVISLVTPPPSSIINNNSHIETKVNHKKTCIEDSHEKYDTVKALIHETPSCINNPFSSKDFPQLNFPDLPTGVNANKLYRSLNNTELDKLIGEQKAAKIAIYPADCMENTCALIFDQTVKFFAANPYRTQAEAASRKLFLEDLSIIIRIGLKGRNPPVANEEEEYVVSSLFLYQ